MAEGTSGPAWLQPLIDLTTKVGVPTVLAGVLLWFVLTRLDTTFQVIQKSEEERLRLLVAMQNTLVQALDRQTDKFTEAMRYNTDANKEIAAILSKRDRGQ